MIPLMKNTFLNEHETKEALIDFLKKSTRLSMDRNCFEFERQFADFQETKDAVLFNSGGSANLALLQSLKNLGRIKEGAKIGFSALTWSTNVMPIIQMNCIPVPIDIDPDTLNVMAHNIEKTIETTSIDVFFATNVLGFAGDLDNIRKLCELKNILFIEDNCESLGTRLTSGLTGNFGQAATFSFFVAHHMSTIEGGMVVTNDEPLAEMLRIVRANGWDRNLRFDQQHNWRNKFDIRNEFDAKYTFYDLGFNFRPTEITGFLGLYQLKFLKENIERRENNFLRLEKMVLKNNELLSINHEHIECLSNFSFPVICKSPELKTKYFGQFSGAGVEIRPMIAGNMQLQPFYRKYSSTLEELPGTDFIHQCGFYFGNYPELSETDIEILSSCLKEY